MRNRVCVTKIEDKTPMEVWTGRISSVKHLKSFGCLDYAKIPMQGKRKLDNRAYIFVGYASATEGYRLWSPKKNDTKNSAKRRFDTND